MRTGPSQKHRILRVLQSGERIHQLAENDGWIRVRTPDGADGWVPAAYVVKATPPSVLLPAVQERLAGAQTKIAAVEEQLAQQTKAIAELERLRIRNAILEDENRRLGWSDTWRKWFTGALIAGVFLLVGGLWPRTSGQRSRRIKL